MNRRIFSHFVLRAFAALALALIPAAARAQLTGCSGSNYTATPNFGLGLPALHITGWGQCYQSTISAIDQLLLPFAAGGGSAQAQVVTLSSAITAYNSGLEVRWLPTYANTGAGATLNVNGLGAKTIVKEPGNAALAAGDISTAAVAIAIYDGTEFELQNPQTWPSTTVNGTSCQLEGTCNVTAAPTGACGGALSGNFPNCDAAPTGPIAFKADSSSAQQFVALNCTNGPGGTTIPCVDTNDGLSWGTAKATVGAACQALGGNASCAGGSGTVFIPYGYGGSVPWQICAYGQSCPIALIEWNTIYNGVLNFLGSAPAILPFDSGSASATGR